MINFFPNCWLFEIVIEFWRGVAGYFFFLVAALVLFGILSGIALHTPDICSLKL